MKRQFPTHKFWDHSPVSHSLKATIDLGNLPPAVPKPIPEMIVSHKVAESPEGSSREKINYAGEYLSKSREISPAKYAEMSKEDERQLMKSRYNQLNDFRQAQRMLEEQNKSNLASNYRNQLELRDKRNKLLKRADFEKDRLHNREAQRLLEIERVRQIDKRKQLQNDFHMSLKTTDERNLQAKENKLLDRQTYNKMIQENAHNEIQREISYKKKFENFHKNLIHRQAVHKQSVLKPELKREQKLYQWVANNEQMYRQYLKQKAEADFDWKKQQTTTTSNVLKNQIALKEKEKNDYRNSYPTRAVENLNMTSNNENLRKFEHDRKVMMQEEYGQFLSRQQEAKTGDYRIRMQKNKSLDRGEFGLIPGINNIASVGTRATYRTGRDIIYGRKFAPDNLYSSVYENDYPNILNATQPVAIPRGYSQPHTKSIIPRSPPMYDGSKGKEFIPGQKDINMDSKNVVLNNSLRALSNPISPRGGAKDYITSENI